MKKLFIKETSEKKESEGIKKLFKDLKRKTSIVIKSTKV